MFHSGIPSKKHHAWKKRTEGQKGQKDRRTERYFIEFHCVSFMFFCSCVFIFDISTKAHIFLLSILPRVSHLCFILAFCLKKHVSIILSNLSDTACCVPTFCTKKATTMHQLICSSILVLIILFFCVFCCLILFFLIDFHNFASLSV